MLNIGCIVCRKDLVNQANTVGKNQPISGTEFFTYGHYGSRVTDTMGRSKHICNICDDCIEKAIEDGYAFELEIERHV